MLVCEIVLFWSFFLLLLFLFSGTNEEELMLLDSRGCPEDPAIFPHLKKTNDGSKSLKGRWGVHIFDF